MLNETGYLVGFNRSTRKIEELSAEVHRVAAESFLAVEAKLHEQMPGGIHNEYYGIGFVAKHAMPEVRHLIREYNDLLKSGHQHKLVIVIELQ